MRILAIHELIFFLVLLSLFGFQHSSDLFVPIGQACENYAATYSSLTKFVGLHVTRDHENGCCWGFSFPSILLL